METEPSKDTIQIAGIKRPTPDCPVSPRCDLSMNKNSPNRNLVYVRRKYETELGKNRTSDKEQTADYPQPEQFEHKGEAPQQQIPEREPMNTGLVTSAPVSMADMTPLYEAPQQQIPEREPMNTGLVTSAPVSMADMTPLYEAPQQQIPERKPMNTGLVTSAPVSMADMTPLYEAPSAPASMADMAPLYEAPSAPVSLVERSNCVSPGVNSTAPTSKNFQGVNDLQWRVRFSQLHAYLENCDHSNQEAYYNWLRSSTPVERSRHAVELEKRAIRLVVEEGREMHRVKALNILAKSNPSNNL